MIKVWGSNFSSLNLTLEAQYTLLGIFPVTLLSDLTHNSIPACVFEVQLIHWQCSESPGDFAGVGGGYLVRYVSLSSELKEYFFYSSKFKIFF